jgi:predicted helicase
MEGAQSALSFMTPENTQRVERQKRSPITVVIGNPPYNMGQVNENDNNKNRKYKVMDARVSETYVKASKAKLKSKYGDPYIKSIRWASDRIGDEGVVVLVTNSSFVHKNVFDGIRKHLAEDFDSIYILDLGGSVKDNPKLSGTTHNVFGIKPGVSINLFIRKERKQKGKKARIFYLAVDEYWRKEEKYKYLDDAQSIKEVSWQSIQPDQHFNWLVEDEDSGFEAFLSVGSGQARTAKAGREDTIFKLYSPGVSTNRDSTAYDFNESKLLEKARQFGREYNSEVRRYQDEKPEDVDDFLGYDKIKWSESLKKDLESGKIFTLDSNNVRTGLYRAFTKKYLYLADLVVDRPGRNTAFLSSTSREEKNRVLCVSDKGFRSQFSVLVTNCIADLHLCSSADGFQVFPFYTYNEDGTNRRENVTDWALEKFRAHYGDKSISKWDIFHYVYAVLHHPLYRERYAANLKRELPRVPYAPDFRAFVEAGARLADLHVNYERQPEHALARTEQTGVALDYRVGRMKLDRDKGTLRYNDFLTLSGIPAETFDYRLGNRSALEWIVDQYQVSTDRRSGITNDPNRADDPEYVVRLVGQVVHVSLETGKLVRALPALGVEQ